MKLIVALTVASAALLSGGCASLSNNVTQPVVVATTCGDAPIQGAQCRIINARGTWNVQSTPASVMIRRAPSDLAIDCRMPSAQAMPMLSESFASRAAWGNIIGLGPVGWVYDASQDAAWKYDSQYTIDMCKGVPPGALKSVQTSSAEQTELPSPMARMQTVVGGEQKYAFSAEAMARQRQCTAMPRAVLNARGPATEVYTVACNNGDALMLRCTWGECKVI